MPNSQFAIAFLLTLCLQSANATLEEKIDSIVSDKQMTVGVAAECGGKTFLRNDTVRFPLLSVFKTHVAMAAIARLRMEGATTDSMIHIDKSRLRADTYSPMKQKYPHESIDMSVAELLRYSVAESDNNACDILIDIAGGIDFVDAYIRSLGIGGFSLSETEATMHSDRSLCYNNWSYPSAMLVVLKYIFEAEGNGLEQLRDIMAGTVTGQDKIKAGMPPGVVLAHKTGSSDRVCSLKIPLKPTRPTLPPLLPLPANLSQHLAPTPTPNKQTAKHKKRRHATRQASVHGGGFYFSPTSWRNL